MLLRRKGMEVVVADGFGESGDGVAVKGERAEALRGAGATIVRIDLADGRSVEEVLADLLPDAVVNAALFPEAGPGLATFLGALRGTSVRHLVHVSDGALYGPEPSPGARAREADPLGPLDSGYLRQRANEELLVQSSGLPFAILRLFTLVGSGFPSWRFPAPAVAALRRGEEVRLDDDAPRDFIHLADAARAVLLALETRPPRAVVNVGSGIDARPSEVLQALAVRLATSLRFTAGPPPERPPRIAETVAAWELLGFTTQRGIGGLVEELAQEGAAGSGTLPGLFPGGEGAGDDRPRAAARPASPAQPVSRRELFGMFRRPFDRSR
jgi:nucleoside-diphosphate-sugar epimerase